MPRGMYGIELGEGFWRSVANVAYENGEMDRYAPSIDTEPGVATGYIRPAGWEVREYVDGRLVWYCKINRRKDE